MENKKGNKYWKVWNGCSWDSWSEEERAKRYADFCKRTYTKNTKEIEIGFIKEMVYK